MFERQMCPCCHYLTLSRRENWETCEVCRWVDDPTADIRGGPNPVSLHQARLNFEAFGACVDEERGKTRRPRPQEFPI